MKTKELITKLQELDPEGNLQVSGWSGDVVLVHKMPWYYDGKVNIFIRDENNKIIGMRKATAEDGDKIVICNKDLHDMAWDEVESIHYGEPPVEYILEGFDEHDLKRYENYKQQARDSFKRIEETLDQGN